VDFSVHLTALLDFLRLGEATVELSLSEPANAFLLLRRISEAGDAFLEPVFAGVLPLAVAVFFGGVLLRADLVLRDGLLLRLSCEGGGCTLFLLEALSFPISLIPLTNGEADRRVCLGESTSWVRSFLTAGLFLLDGGDSWLLVFFGDNSLLDGFLEESLEAGVGLVFLGDMTSAGEFSLSACTTVLPVL